jgi:hypothetical protein
MCGAHAQIMTAAEQSVGIRMADTTRIGVRHALWVDRELVKTFGPRGTVHLLPARDLAMWTGALSAVPAGPDALPIDVRLTAGETDAVIDAIAVALEEADLTVEELGERVIATVGPWAATLAIPAFNGLWPRWRRALIPAAQRGVLCFGPDRGRNVTYAGPRRWLPGFVPGSPDEAIAELLRRYLRSYGPATPAHFAQWLAAPRRWASELFDRMRDELAEVDIEGTLGWLAADDIEAWEQARRSMPPSVRLLPYFDAFTVGCHPRERLFPGEAAVRALSRGQAGNVPVLLVDGIVRGIWHQRRAGRRLHVTVELFDEPGALLRQQIEDEVARIGQILEGDPVLTLGSVNAGKHL